MHPERTAMCRIPWMSPRCQFKVSFRNQWRYFSNVFRFITDNFTYPNSASVYFGNSLSPIITASNGGLQNANVRYYHLVKPIDEHQYFSNKISERTHKAIPEIYLTRLLSTKGTIQKFVDDFFNTVLTANEALPPTVKWLFDLFDEEYRRHNIIDPEVLHAWKSNR